MTPFPAFERYRDIIDDFDAFLEVASTPLPTCVWVNTLRTTPEALEARFKLHKIPFRRSAFFEGAYILPHDIAPGASLEYLAGLYHVQEEIALTAVDAMDPQPGEKILDLCASPGNKTARIAIKTGDTGTLVGNELRAARLASMRFNLDRLGVTSVLVSNKNGSALPLSMAPFDRVMADVPCTCEGTVRRSIVGKQTPDAIRLKMSRTQGHLLMKALKMTKPGGTVVYATCTFAPEENECVLDEILGDRGEIVPFDIPGLVHSPGLQSWQGRTFRSDIQHAQRYYPHQNNTGGFFVARIKVK